MSSQLRRVILCLLQEGDSFANLRQSSLRWSYIPVVPPRLRFYITLNIFLINSEVQYSSTQISIIFSYKYLSNFIRLLKMVQYPILMYISLFSPVVPIFAGSVRVKLISQEMKILILYLMIGLAVDILSTWFIRDAWLDLGLWHAYIIIEYIFVMFIFIFLQEVHRVKRMFQVLLALYFLFWCCAKFTFEPFNGSYSITSSISRVILALSAGYTLFIVIGNRVQPLLSDHRFWVLLSFVFFYLGTLMPVALISIFFNQPGNASFSIASINWALSIAANILFTVGVLCPQTRTS